MASGSRGGSGASQEGTIVRYDDMAILKTHMGNGRAETGSADGWRGGQEDRAGVQGEGDTSRNRRLERPPALHLTASPTASLPT